MGNQQRPSIRRAGDAII